VNTRAQIIERMKSLEIFPQSYLQKLALGTMPKSEREEFMSDEVHMKIENKENQMNNNQPKFGIVRKTADDKFVLCIYVPHDASYPIYTSPRGSASAIAKLKEVLEEVIGDILDTTSSEAETEMRLQAWMDHCEKQHAELEKMGYEVAHLKAKLQEAQKSKMMKLGDLHEGIVFRFVRGAESTHYKIIDNTREDGQIKYQHLKRDAQYTVSDLYREVIVFTADAEHFNDVFGELEDLVEAGDEEDGPRGIGD